MASQFTFFQESDAWPDGFMPGTVAPFVMRYGTDFLVAMQRAAAAHDATQVPSEAEPA